VKRNLSDKFYGCDTPIVGWVPFGQVGCQNKGTCL